MMTEVPQYAEVRYEQVPHQDVVELDIKDAQMLMKIAQAEAGNQSIDGMALVMQTVLNRVADDDYPDTVYEVITQKGQFQSYANGRYDKAIPCVNCHYALAEIEKGTFADDTVIAFEVTGVRSLDKYYMYAFTLGDHDFYTEK